MSEQYKPKEEPEYIDISSTDMDDLISLLKPEIELEKILGPNEEYLANEPDSDTPLS